MILCRKRHGRRYGTSVQLNGIMVVTKKEISNLILQSNFSCESNQIVRIIFHAHVVLQDTLKRRANHYEPFIFLCRTPLPPLLSPLE